MNNKKIYVIKILYKSKNEEDNLDNIEIILKSNKKEAYNTFIMLYEKYRMNLGVEYLQNDVILKNFFKVDNGLDCYIGTIYEDIID